MKKAYNDGKKTLLVDTLGAFLVTRDLEGYAMIGLDKTNHIRCISCGYPTLGGFAPEKHSRFDRWQTCSFECWQTHAHYKDMNVHCQQTDTVKPLTDTIHATSAYMAKSIRHANCEEIQHGTSILPARAAECSRQHLITSFVMSMIYGWNVTNGVGLELVKQLKKFATFESIVEKKTVMGRVPPSVMITAKRQKEFSSVLMSIHGRENLNVSITKKMDWKKFQQFLSLAQDTGSEPSYVESSGTHTTGTIPIESNGTCPSTTNQHANDEAKKMAVAATGETTFIQDLEREMETLKKEKDAESDQWKKFCRKKEAEINKNAEQITQL